MKQLKLNTMRKLFSIGLLASVFLLSCSKDDNKLASDFSVQVNGESPNAQLVITNNSTGAESYVWTFGEGASTRSSTEKELR